MSKKIISSIVLILGLLIIIAFLVLLYGMYLKISTNGQNISDSSIIFSSNLVKDERIKNIEVIDKKRLLILIEKNNQIRGAIYDSEKNQIIRIIER
ncbi:hypothetical protein OAJ89_04940 [Alphaproteobacteria bacterium]|nr:hypothetical protein [Alphaproteobacteria bacterium]